MYAILVNKKKKKNIKPNFLSEKHRKTLKEMKTPRYYISFIYLQCLYHLFIFRNVKNYSSKKNVQVKDTKSTSFTKVSSVQDEMAFGSACLKSLIPDDIVFEDDLHETDESKEITIQQAFADEELIAEFQYV